MSYRRKRRDIKSEINIVPFLDVLLVLLLIFMATAPIISQSVQVELPDAVESQSVSNEDKVPVILEVSGIGQYSLSIGGERSENLTEEMVTQMAKQEYDKDSNTMFLVGGAKDVPYEEVIKALNLLHLAGIKSVGLMTNPI
ncbi:MULTISPECIES: colicin uptake protein TolR [Avibacterium]|uniref:colicin uptake protein TolR n=1 Tax=Avibacterium TaxID=292486 RepID=UPI00202600CC|nr:MULTISPECIES: colicin uptake protein TolR [unclassified Avibacterium]URL03039.1 colicin uptake protein TolR [Avibacterium sp. 20-126]MCW9698715.1 colicin uptake protein TolR [Avibacterium sp. 20-129]MCW9719072.1 colicin uptake protein TolR [Avibacterium sp. 21-599]MCW9732527.1 colicin uptake protein TolR [Avibacterium sp. 20-15]URL05434.1 colicin uptake protein TolR [Avibacterium sp. 20-132]